MEPRSCPSSLFTLPRADVPPASVVRTLILTSGSGMGSGRRGVGVENLAAEDGIGVAGAGADDLGCYVGEDGVGRPPITGAGVRLDVQEPRRRQFVGVIEEDRARGLVKYGKPVGVVAAINSKNAGVKAELVNTGNALKPYKILVTGATGVTQDFTLSSATPEVNFSAIAGYERATDAVFSVNGIAMTRNSNVVTDAIAGVTINLRSATSGAAVLDLARDTASLKTKMTDLVTAYNDASDLLNQVSDPKSTLDTYGATLVGDSTVRMVRQQLRSIIQGTSSTPGNSVSALWQLGFSLDEKGVMSLDSTKLDTALQSNFNDVVKSLTGNQENLSAYSNAPAGLMGDAVRKITGLLDKSGPLMSQSESASTQNTKYQKDLTDLQTRMDALLARYTKQFAAMDTLVGQINTQKTSLKSTFDGMMAAYTNK